MEDFFYIYRMDFAAYDNMKSPTLQNLFEEILTYFHPLEKITDLERHQLLSCSERLLDVYIDKKFAGRDRITHLDQGVFLYDESEYIRLLGASAIGLTVKWYMDVFTWTNECISIYLDVDNKNLNILERDILKTLEYNLFQYMPEALY